jgi:hypothetical protein
MSWLRLGCSECCQRIIPWRPHIKMYLIIGRYLSHQLSPVRTIFHRMNPVKWRSYFSQTTSDTSGRKIGHDHPFTTFTAILSHPTPHTKFIILTFIILSVIFTKVVAYWSCHFCLSFSPHTLSPIILSAVQSTWFWMWSVLKFFGKKIISARFYITCTCREISVFHSIKHGYRPHL